MELTKKHYKAIELLILGLKYTEIAKKVPCSRQSIYDWLKDDDFHKELDRCRHEIKTQGNNRILAKVDTYIDKIEEIAFNSSSDNVKLNALQFLYESVNGKASQKVDTTITDNRENSNDIGDIDKLASSLPDDNSILSQNVIDMEDRKKAE
jgi:predicted DNA-binding protein YlxM (UPF0122 family)